MIYTKIQFGTDLKNQLLEIKDADRISKWTYEVFLTNCQDLEDNLREILITLNLMEEGPEFAFSYEELDKIADDLIAGREVNLSNNPEK